jgi:hypothetical protein
MIVIPQWAVNFFDLFCMASSEPSNGAKVAVAQIEHQAVAASLTGQQAPLGVWNGPAQLQTKTAMNSGAWEMRKQIVGNVNAENVYEGGDKVDEEWVDGRDDVAHHHAALCQCITNGTCCQNVHIYDFSLDGNDPSSRYSEVRGAYSLIDVIAHSVA